MSLRRVIAGGLITLGGGYLVLDSLNEFSKYSRPSQTRNAEIINEDRRNEPKRDPTIERKMDYETKRFWGGYLVCAIGAPIAVSGLPRFKRR